MGLEGELNDKWTKYKPDNAIEANYSWKLHAEPDLGVPLAPSAMDYEGCYVDPSKVGAASALSSSLKKKKTDDEAYDELFDDMEDKDESTTKETPSGPAPLDVEDENLIHWKGHMGDSIAEELQRLRDKARAEARLGAKGMKKSSTSSSNNNNSNNKPTPKTISMKEKKHFSRVLNEKNPFFMKKTTYLANDHNQKVHDFKSLAQTKREKEMEIQKKLSTSKSNDKSVIEQSFVLANKKSSTSTTTTTTTASAGSKRKHPSKENVEAVYEIPLLPDDKTWGYNFIHVVLDSLPKKDVIQREITDKEMETAFIGDVQKGKKNQRMECNLLLHKKNNAGEADSDLDQYEIIHKYDLDIIPLKEEDLPPSQFLFIVDEDKGIATYHPISSRVQLSSGRPSDDVGIREITKRDLEEDELNDIEMKLADVDVDLAEKYGKEQGLDGDDDDELHQQQPKTFNPYGNFASSSDEEM